MRYKAIILDDEDMELWFGEVTSLRDPLQMYEPHPIRVPAPPITVEEVQTNITFRYRYFFLDHEVLLPDGTSAWVFKPRH